MQGDTGYREAEYRKMFKTEAAKSQIIMLMTLGLILVFCGYIVLNTIYLSDTVDYRDSNKVIVSGRIISSVGLMMLTIALFKGSLTLEDAPEKVRYGMLWAGGLIISFFILTAFWSLF